VPDRKRLTLEGFKQATSDKEATNSDQVEAVIPKGLTVEVKAVEGDDLVREFIASTGAVDRDGDTIDPAGWELQNFNKAGVFLWAHSRELPPIGDPFATFAEGNALKTRVRFAPPDMPHPLDSPRGGEGFAHSIMRMYDERLLKAVSVGFLPIEWTFNEERGGFMPMDFKRQELIEVSAVPVPSNPEALAIARSKGINLDPILAWAETVRDASGLWVPEDGIKSLLDQAAGEKTISVPKAEPAAEVGDGIVWDGEPITLDAPVSITIAGEARAEDIMKAIAEKAKCPPPAPAAAYAASVKAAEDAESEIISAIESAVDALSARKSSGLVSADNADRLSAAMVKAAELLGPLVEVPDDTTPEPAPSGLGMSRAEVKALAEKTADELARKHTGRWPD
jgi:hypothetical protein